MDSFILMTHQRRSTLKLDISVSKVKNAENAFTTSPINFGDLAQVAIAIKCKITDTRDSRNSRDTADFEVSVKMIKNENTKKCTMQVTCENFSKPICLSEEWAETVILTKRFNTKGRGEYYSSATFYYTTEINITLLEETSITSMPMFVNKQLYEDVESTDFQLQTADGAVDVHKAVLFIHSDMFRTMFRGEWKEIGEGQIKVDGVTAQTLQHLKDYMYLGTLPDEGLEPLLLFAACYMMDKLKKDCIAKLVNTIKTENFDKVVEFAVQNNMYDLVRALIMEIPDDVINKDHQLKKNKNKNGLHYSLED